MIGNLYDLKDEDGFGPSFFYWEGIFVKIIGGKQSP